MGSTREEEGEEDTNLQKWQNFAFTVKIFSNLGSCDLRTVVGTSYSITQGHSTFKAAIPCFFFKIMNY